jgi:hypothetical protein
MRTFRAAGGMSAASALRHAGGHPGELCEVASLGASICAALDCPALIVTKSGRHIVHGGMTHTV